jgi:heterotetrameric sarcosine oxidase delta subunit
VLLIPCPHCGARAQIEFSYGGDVAATRPADARTLSTQEWLDHLYLRDNPRGAHWEWWQHTAGCRRWVRVHRDTLSHEVLGAAAATGPLEPGDP